MASNLELSNYYREVNFLDLYKVIAGLMFCFFKLENKRVIDIGCGSGMLDLAIAKMGPEVLAIDGGEKVEVFWNRMFTSPHKPKPQGLTLKKMSVEGVLLGIEANPYGALEEVVKDFFGEDQFNFGICMEVAQHIEKDLAEDSFPYLFHWLGVEYIWWSSAVPGQGKFVNCQPLSYWERLFGMFFEVDWELTEKIKSRLLTNASKDILHFPCFRDNLMIFKKVKL